MFILSQCDLQYCAKEMQTKFAEISEITRISAIKFRTFVSDENAAKFRCFYCSNVGEISQATWWIKTKFCGMRRNFVGKSRAGRTKFHVIRTKFHFHETKFCLGGTKSRLSRIGGSWLQNVAVIITSCKRTSTCKRDHYLKKKHRNDCYNCGENLRQNSAFWLVASYLLSQHNFVVNVSLANTVMYFYN